MKIRLGYDISYNLPNPTPMVLMLNVHASRMADLLEPDEIRTDPLLPLHHYYDSFGNRCARLVAPRGILRLTGRTLIQDGGKPEAQPVDMPQIPVQEWPERRKAISSGAAHRPMIRCHCFHFSREEGRAGGRLPLRGQAR